MIRTLKRRFGIAAPRVAVHTHVAWYWRAIATGVLLVLVSVIAWGTFVVGQRLAGSDRAEFENERRELVAELEQLRTENESLRAAAAAAERQLQIETATQQSVANQVRTLTAENVALKEDLSFFQSLTSGTAAPGTVAISKMHVEPDVLPGEYRYRLLVVYGHQRGGKDFQGRLQLLVDTEQDGKQVVLTLPAAGEDTSSFRLNFRFFQRVEGRFTLPQGTQAKRVHARVIEEGTAAPKTSQTLTL